MSDDLAVLEHAPQRQVAAPAREPAAAAPSAAMLPAAIPPLPDLACPRSQPPPVEPPPSDGTDRIETLRRCAALLGRAIRRSDDDSPHIFGTDRNSLTGDIWADVKSGAVEKRIYSFFGGVGEALVDTVASMAALLKPGGIAKALAGLGNLPQNLEIVWQHKEEFWERFKALPDDQQAKVVGQVVAQIEMVLAGGLGGGAPAAAAGEAPAMASTVVGMGGGAGVLSRGGSLTIDLAKLGGAATEAGRLAYLSAKTGEGGAGAQHAADEAKAGDAAAAKPAAADPPPPTANSAGKGAKPKVAWKGRFSGMEVPAVQAGHRFNKASGAAEAFAVEDADLNQLSSATVESGKGFTDKATIKIKGFYVDKASAQLWAGSEAGQETKLTRQMVDAAEECPGWVPPKQYADPNRAFMRAMLKVLRDDPEHPFRFLVEVVKAASN